MTQDLNIPEDDVSLEDHAPKYPGERMDLKCAECGALMGLRESKHGPFYGCSAWRETGCKGSHGAHPSGAPFGTPADKTTKQARIEAHRVFDEIWKQRLLNIKKSRNANRHMAYSWMREAMNLTHNTAHIGLFSKADCEALMLLVHRDYPQLRTRWSRLMYDDAL